MENLPNSTVLIAPNVCCWDRKLLARTGPSQVLVTVPRRWSRSEMQVVINEPPVLLPFHEIKQGRLVRTNTCNAYIHLTDTGVLGIVWRIGGGSH